MSANVCPSCGGAVMSFGQFVREADPGKTFACRSCGTPLRRSNAVWALLLVAALLLAAVPLLAIRAEWSPLNVFLVSLLALPIWFIAVKFLGWTLVPWRSHSAA